jgi:hypothetical protein
MSQDAENWLKAPGAVSRGTEQLSSFIYSRMLLRKNRDKKMTTTVRVSTACQCYNPAIKPLNCKMKKVYNQYC